MVDANAILSNIFFTAYMFYWNCRKSLNSKLYANSLIGVGVVSSLYHSSRGKVRKYMRWADYTMIGTATIVSCQFNHERIFL